MTPELRRHLGAERAKVAYIIRHEMRQRGYSQASLSRALQCSEANVAKVIAGYGHSPKVLDAMREMGVPEKYLFDPRRYPIVKITPPDAAEPCCD